MFSVWTCFSCPSAPALSPENHAGGRQVIKPLMPQSSSTFTVFFRPDLYERSVEME